MSAKLINIVLDLETISTREDAAIIQIGCCVPRFDCLYLPHNVPSLFCSTVAYEVVLSSEFHKDKATMAWWEEQSKEARMVVFSGQKNYDEAFDEFAGWIADIKSEGADVAIWGNGSDFDNRLLSYSLSAYGHREVWNFRNNRDLRTIRALFPLTKAIVHTEQIKHTALGDAIYEAEILNAVWAENYFHLGDVL